MKNAKILWVNPSFLDYRVPFYSSLNALCGGNLYLAYSKERVPERCVLKISEALGCNAMCLEKEKRFSLGTKTSDFANSHLSIPYPKGLGKLLGAVDADIIIGEGFFQWTPWALKYALKRHIPLLIAYERTAHTERNCPAYRVLYRKLINHFVAGYLVNGSLCRHYLVNYLKADSRIITEGVMAADSESLARRTALCKPLKNKKGYVYLYVGRLIKRKGVDYLLRAWKRHSLKFGHDRLLIVGDGPERERLQDLAVPSVDFVGEIDYDSVHEYYAKADVFVIPTLEDNWSLVIPEAMSCGLPIACSCYNGCYPELVKEGRNGKVFDPLNEDDTVSTLGHFHEENLEMLGHESRIIESEYSPMKCAERAYERICKTLEQYNG